MHKLILKIFHPENNSWGILNTVSYQTQEEKVKAEKYLRQQKDQWERVYYNHGEKLQIFAE